MTAGDRGRPRPRQPPATSAQALHKHAFRGRCEQPGRCWAVCTGGAPPRRRTASAPRRTSRPDPRNRPPPVATRRTSARLCPRRRWRLPHRRQEVAPRMRLLSTERQGVLTKTMIKLLFSPSLWRNGRRPTAGSRPTIHSRPRCRAACGQPVTTRELTLQGDASPDRRKGGAILPRLRPASPFPTCRSRSAVPDPPGPPQLAPTQAGSDSPGSNPARLQPRPAPTPPGSDPAGFDPAGSGGAFPADPVPRPPRPPGPPGVAA